MSAKIRLSKNIPFRPELPGYEEKTPFLKWMGDNSREDLGALNDKLFDQLVKGIMAQSTNARIENKEIGLNDAMEAETMNFIRYGSRQGKATGQYYEDSVTITADEIVITQELLKSLNCALTLSSFARLRDFQTSFLTFIDDNRIVISNAPTSEENKTWEQWRLSGTEFEELLIRNRHLEGLRNGTIQPPVEEKPKFKMYPDIVRDNSFNQAEKVRQFIKRELEVLRNLGR